MTKADVPRDELRRSLSSSNNAVSPDPADVVSSLVPLPAADMPLLRSEDLARAYALFLGKTPPQNPPSLDLSDVLRVIFASEEFRSEILKNVLLREALPSDRFSGDLPFRMIDWVQQRLPIEPATATVCGVARSWLDLLEILLADVRLTSLAPDFAVAGISEVIGERLARDPRFTVRRSVVGAFDAASAFEVQGWAVDLCDKTLPVQLEFYADGAFIGTVCCDKPRPDVADVVGGRGLVGFTFRIATAHRIAFANGCVLTAVDSILRKPISDGLMVYGEATHQLDGMAATRREIVNLREALERIEAQLPQFHRMASLPVEAYDEYWERFYRPVPNDLARQRMLNRSFAYRPLMSVVVPCFKSDGRLLEKAVASVIAQSYESWELIVSDDASPDPSEFNLVYGLHAGDTRIRWLKGEKRGGIAQNTNRCIDAAQGDYVVFLDHDDELAPDALHHATLALQDQRYTLLYSDEDRIEEDDYGRCVHRSPFFKPDFDPDMLLAMNYICHLVIVQREALRGIGGLRIGIDGAQDHDLLLRLTLRISPEKIHHIPRVLYHWRLTAGSVSLTPENQESLRRTIVTVVDAHLRERGVDAAVEHHSDPIGKSRMFATRVRWRLPPAAPRVSIIIPTRDRLELLRPCLESIKRAAPVYPGEIEVLIVDNDSTDLDTLNYLNEIGSPPAIQVLRYGGAFNWSAINNYGARAATGEVLIFLNNDTVVLTPEWCNEIVANALRPDVGAVGARLLYQDGTIQHAGVLIGVEGVAGHEAVGDPPHTGGYFGRSQVLRSAAAVTGACLATRRELFQTLGDGFDEFQLKVAFNDVDYCMRARAANYRVVYTPYAVLYHFESKSRGRELTSAQLARHRSEASVFRARWGHSAATDPYFNPHFERYARPFERLRAPPD